MNNTKSEYHVIGLCWLAFEADIKDDILGSQSGWNLGNLGIVNWVVTCQLHMHHTLHYLKYHFLYI